MTDRPLLLDLFCGAGGAAMGYHRAGFDVIGIDLKPQPRYPFPFVQADGLGPPIDLAQVDAIHASPPCQRYSTMTKMHRPEDHPDLVAPVRELLQASGRPYVIENVEGSPLIEPVTLCGSHFGLRVRRHRLFETGRFIADQPQCDHRPQGRVVGVYGHTGGTSTRDGGGPRSTVSDWRAAMDIDWMTRDQLAQAIPPAYTEHIGRQLIQHLDPYPAEGES